jgi:hypothetical protein
VLTEKEAKLQEDIIFTTRKGGKLKKVGHRFFFTAQPNEIGIKVGDELPDDWELLPYNDAARRSMEQALPDTGPLTDEDIVFK